MSQPTYPIACVVLASGLGRRFGANKLLTPFNGQPLVQHILTITNNIFMQRVVVTRHVDLKKLCDAQRIDCVLHHEPYLNDTVRLGVSYILQAEQNGISADSSKKDSASNIAQKICGLLFATGDQPLLTQTSIQRLCKSFLTAPDKIHRLAAGSTPGNPVIFPVALAQELQHLSLDKGGGVLIKKYPELVVQVPVQDKYELYDIDTKADFTALAEHCRDLK